MSIGLGVGGDFSKRIKADLKSIKSIEMPIYFLHDFEHTHTDTEADLEPQ